MKFAQLMSTRGGRLTRIAAGIALVPVGLFGIGGGPGLAVALFALLPITTGVVNLCPISPFFGLPARGCSAPIKR